MKKNLAYALLLTFSLAAMLFTSCDKSKENNGVITVKKTSLQLYEGETVKIEASVEPSGALAFSSLDKSVATVDKNGLVTAKKEGKTIIEVSASNASEKKNVQVEVKKLLVMPPKGSEMPVLKFFFESNEELIAAVGAHEAAIGRQPDQISFSEGKVRSGFVGPDCKVITGVIYDMELKGDVAMHWIFCRKPWTDYSDVDRELKGMGFELTSSQPVEGRFGTCIQWTRPDKLTAELYEDTSRPEIPSSSFVTILKKR